MTPEEVNLAWARRVVADKAWLLHIRTLVIGPAEELFDGVDRVHTGENGLPVSAPVIKLLTGHALLASPNTFVELVPREVAFYQLVVEKFAEFMKGAVAHAAARGVPAATAVTLLTSLLQAQLRALETVTSPQPGDSAC